MREELKGIILASLVGAALLLISLAPKHAEGKAAGQYSSSSHLSSRARIMVYDPASSAGGKNREVLLTGLQQSQGFYAYRNCSTVAGVIVPTGKVYDAYSYGTPLPTELYCNTCPTAKLTGVVGCFQWAR